MKDNGEFISSKLVVELFMIDGEKLPDWASKNRVRFVKDKRGNLIYSKDDIARVLARKVIKEDGSSGR